MCIRDRAPIVRDAVQPGRVLHIVDAADILLLHGQGPVSYTHLTALYIPQRHFCQFRKSLCSDIAQHGEGRFVGLRCGQRMKQTLKSQNAAITTQSIK